MAHFEDRGARDAADGAGDAGKASHSGALSSESGALSSNPMALSVRRERFCHHYVLSGNAAQAAYNAGYSRATARHQGARLLTNADIRARVAEMRADLALRHRIERDALMAKFEACYLGALRVSMFAVAIRAVEGQARLAGLYPDGADSRGRRAKAPRADGADASDGKINRGGAPTPLAGGDGGG